MAYLTRERAIKAQGFKTQEIILENFDKNGDANVIIRELSSSEAEHFSLKMVTPSGDTNVKGIEGMRAQAIVWATVDEKDERIFNKADIAKLKGMPNRIIQTWADAIFELSGIFQTDEDEEGADPKA